MLKIIFIRHGKTKGNEERRYVGRNDESLSDLGRKEIEDIKDVKDVDKVYCSPLKRALETAFILYSGKTIEIVDGLKELDFGDFESKNYDELKNDIRYQLWIDSNGLLDVPNGETNNDFINRIIGGFNYVRNQHQNGTIAIVSHGGVIMRLMAYLLSDDNIYNYQVSNGHGFEVVFDEDEVVCFKKV